MRTDGPNRFGSALRDERRAAGLTQEELAECAGLSVRAVSDLERGIARPRPKTVARLADALQLTGADRDQFGGVNTPSSAGADPASWPVPPHQLPAACPISPAGPRTGRADQARRTGPGAAPATVVISAIAGRPGWARPRWRCTGPTTRPPVP